MPTFAYSGRTRGGQTVTGERVADTMDAAIAALRREQIRRHADRSGEGRREGRAAKAKGKKGVSAPSKILAIFTRQFSVMIDAGLPLVQCLEILGEAGAAQGLRRRHPAGPVRRRGGLHARRRDEAAPEGVRSAVLEHDRGRRGGRYSRHDSQAPRGLHREERQAEGAGQVGDDLSDRRHLHRDHRRGRDSAGRSFRRSRSCSPASARSCRSPRAS